MESARGCACLGDLVGMADIADMAGVGKPAASNWLTRYASFPTPVHTVSHGTKLFSRTEVADWLRATGLGRVHQ